MRAPDPARPPSRGSATRPASRIAAVLADRVASLVSSRLSSLAACPKGAALPLLAATALSAAATAIVVASADAAADPPQAAAPAESPAPTSSAAGGVPAVPADTPPAASSAGFGSSSPSERFIQSFQQQVTKELHDTLERARSEQHESLEAFESRQRQLATDQLDALQRAIAAAQAQGAQGAPAAPDPADPAGAAGVAAATNNPAFEAPRVHQRQPYAAGSASIGTGQGTASAMRADPAMPPAPTGEPQPAGNADWPAMPAVPAIPTSAGDTVQARITVGLRAGADAHPGQPNLAPNGFAEGQLLNGVVTVVGGTERESVVALRGAYQAANGYTTDLDGCFALVQGRPEPAAGRIDFKVSRLTCNFDGGASKTWDVAGWLVDDDGIRGLRATLVHNLDRKAAVAALGGAVGGIGSRVSQQQYATAASPLGSTSTFAGNPITDAAGGAAAGAGNALQQSIGDYYQLFAPSLQVGGGRAVTVVIANELALPSAAAGVTSTHGALP